MIVAGFDGTSLGEAAVAEAAVRAGPAGYVFVVCAYRAPLRCLGRPYFDRRLREARMAGQRVLDDLWRRRDTLPRSHFIQQLICGRPAQAIGGVASTRHVDAIVVGARPTGRIRAMRGDLVYELQRTAQVPVIAITAPRAIPRRRQADADVGLAIPDVETWW